MIDVGFPAKNVGAAGYGEFDPVAPNDTKENKQLNRRIEIILVPDLSELPNLTAELLARGMSEQDVRKVLGENLLRALSTAEQRAVR